MRKVDEIKRLNRSQAHNEAPTLRESKARLSHWPDNSVSNIGSRISHANRKFAYTKRAYARGKRT